MAGSLFGSLFGARSTVSDLGWQDDGWSAPPTAYGPVLEQLDDRFVDYLEGAYKANGVVFTCNLVRLQVFSQARFQFQRMRDGAPGDLFGTRALDVLDKPWESGTTADMLARLIQDVDLAGNAFLGVHGGRLRRLRPDLVTLIFGSREWPESQTGLAPDAELVGLLYSFDGRHRFYGRGEFAHWAPIPDPEASYRGMTWISPIVREVMSDNAATTHKWKFFENGAVPSTVIAYGEDVAPERVTKFAEMYRASHAGVDNAYKTLHLGGGADLKSYGADMKQIDFKVVQGAGETRIAAASGVGSIIAQFSEGMAGSSLNAGNYSAARRRFSDTTMQHLWSSVSGALAPLVDVPPDARLWFAHGDIPFLQEDRKDAAEIQQQRASTIRTLVEAGFTPESVIAAVQNENMSLLVHTGKLSVQLQDPTEEAADADADL